MFLVIRGALALFVGVAGLHDAALPALRRRGGGRRGRGARVRPPPARVRAAAGAGIGTVGLAAEWGWSHVWMAHPWPASMLAAAVLPSRSSPASAAAMLGARISQSLALPEQPAGGPAADRGARGRGVGRRGVLVALAIPLPRTGGDGTRAAIVPHRAGPGAVDVAVTLDPPRAAPRRQWFEILSWQGRTPGHTAPDRAPARDRAGPLRRRPSRAGRRQLEVDAPPRPGLAPHGPRGVPAAVARVRPARRAGRARAPARWGPTRSCSSARRPAARAGCRPSPTARWPRSWPSGSRSSRGRSGLAEPRGGARPRATLAPMAAARRSRLSTDVRREQLVALGIEIFSDRPFDEVSIDDIAAAAGISKGLLYHYFPSKRDFYVAVMSRSARRDAGAHRARPGLRAARAPRRRPRALPRVRRDPRARVRDGAARRHRQRPGGGAHRRGGARRDGRRGCSPTSPAASPPPPACASRSAAGSGSSRPRASTGSSTAGSGAPSCATCSSRRSAARSAPPRRTTRCAERSPSQRCAAPPRRLGRPTGSPSERALTRPVARANAGWHPTASRTPDASTAPRRTRGRS